MSNERRELSRSARALIDAARDADGPSAADRDRVRRALAIAIAASAGTAGATAGAAAGAKALAGSATSVAGAGTGAVAGTAATGTVATIAAASLFTKVAIAVVAIGVGSGAIVAVNHYASTPSERHVAATAVADRDPPTRGRGEPETLVIPSSFEAPVAVEPEVATEVPEAVGPTEAVAPVVEARATPTHRVRATPASTEAETASHEAELRLLFRAGAQRTAPDERLLSVDEHVAQFPHGDLAGERERARRRAVADLCAQGPDAVARFLAAHPSSSSAPLIRTTCPAAR